MSIMTEPLALPTERLGSPALLLTLEVSDPEVVGELEKQAEGPARETYALAALRVGVLALRQASGQLDSAAVREAGQEILRELSEVLADRGSEITGEITIALRQYFDPSTGTLPQKIESLIRNDGDLERVLRAHLAPENSTIARALVAHLGEGSPLFKLLSPDDAHGLKSRIESMLKEVLEERQQKILREFSLDTEESALSRLVRKVRESNGDLTTDVRAQVEALIGEFSLDKPDSALSRLVGKVEIAQEMIGKSLTLDDEGSSLSRLKRELQTTIDELVRSNADFQSDVREALAKLQSHREAAAQSTLHGLAFEDQLGQLLDAETRRLNDIHESCGATTGTISHCKTGDFVTTLGPDSAAPGAHIVWEAKSNKSYGVAEALREIDHARKNREAQVGIFVFAQSAAPDGLEPFARYGNDLVVVWDSDDGSTDLYVRAALSVARALVVRETQQSAESEQALKAIELSTRAIEKQIEHLGQIRTWAETVKNNGERIADRASHMNEALVREVEELNRQLAALKAKAAEVQS
jgi:hypothetical protein